MYKIADSLDAALLARLMAALGTDAHARRFSVAPNPCVGAAVLSAGKVVARGFHNYFGGPHAEIEALRLAKESSTPSSEWDLLVVTLEPCSTRGKTGPCVEAILKSGIARVVVGSLDPDLRHQGKGLEKLRDAGVQVFLMEGDADLKDISPHFLRWSNLERLRRPRPWIVAKWAQTRTGQLQPPKDIGEGRWISCDESRTEVLELRARVDAIVSGVGTVLDDNPRLSVRPPVVCDNPPVRIILDSYLRTPPDANLFKETEAGESAGPLVILTMAGADGTRWRALEAAGAEVHGLHTEDGHQVSLREVQTWMWERGFRRVLIETGPTLLNSYLSRGYVDQVRIYTGDVNGGRGTSMGTWLGSAKIEGRLDREVGADAVLDGFLKEDQR
ncbi:MAG: diaminohydroxyphosphoribosylaminopyrimidine deaminase [Planctomycetota bacterium]|jgi:diaminohydroxyphosphoribosylaminopyrimidine deaminase/5-amino-6-(5-phosphoribosylamino)uracil reductase